MKMKRRWKVINTMGLIFIGMTGLAVYLNGVNSGAQDITLWLQMSSGWMGYILGVIVYSSGLDAEEREQAEWKFQDNVYLMYEDCRVNKWDEEKAINETAIYYDTTPSDVRRIVKIYEGES